MKKGAVALIGLFVLAVGGYFWYLQKNSTPTLIENLGSDEPVVRTQAIDELVNRGEPVVPALIEAAKGDDIAVKKGAIEALGEIDVRDPEPVLRLLIDSLKHQPVRKQAIQALAKKGVEADSAVSALTTIIDDQKVRAQVRIAAIDSLQQINAKATVDPLCRCLKDNDSQVQVAAAKKLGQIGSSKAVPFLIEALDEGDEKLQEASIRALEKIGEEAAAAVPSLVEIVKGDDKKMSMLATRALGQMGAEAGRELIPFLQDMIPEVRILAATALGEIGANPQMVVAALVTALSSDRDPKVRAAAARALGKIGADAKAAQPALEEQHGLERDRDVKLEIDKALMRIRK